MKETIKLRLGTDRDALIVMAWRSNPLVYQGFLKQTSPLQWENHWGYWRKQKNWNHWIIVYGEGEYERPIGQVNIQHLDTDCPEIGYFIGEVPLWSKGFATEAVNLTLEKLRMMGYKRVCADVKMGNVASQKTLIKVGFRKMPSGRDGLVGYMKEL